MHELRQAVERVTAGQSDHRLPPYRSGELGSLRRALERMAGEFNQRLRSIRAQRNELEAVLGSMVEGVLAVDQGERLISLNQAAADLLGLSTETSIGRSIQEAVRNTAIQQFVGTALTHEEPTQADLVIRVSSGVGETEECFLQAQGAALRDATGQRIGALIVLQDVTRLRRLELIRRDFVANVSHEIKTPITAIKAAVETMIDSNGESAEGEGGGGAAGADARPFLDMIARQSDRLHAIVEDLLSLARVEQDAERNRVEREPTAIQRVVRSAVESCAANAASKSMRVISECPDDLIAPANAELLEQALVNLLDNAVKYAPEGSRIWVRAAPYVAGVQLDVIDEGPGIEAEHLPRLFERFYRTDKARSRAEGGTGLGLAIVKHIANAHGGRVRVESTVGQGSRFTLLLPGDPPQRAAS
jgi:two-component system phosphate regulon sensor histidine kinase PhoR